MPTFKLIAKQISQPMAVGRGTRIRTTGSGSIEFMPESLAFAQSAPDSKWKVWPKGTASGYMDTVRALVIRAVATGPLTVEVEEGVNERIGDVVCWSEDVQGFNPINQPIPFAASVTPNFHGGSNVAVGLLTGNITIAAPTNPSIGAKLTFNYSADGTAGRAITYAAVFKKSTVPGSVANAKATHSFVYDGTHWVEVGGPLLWL